MKEGKMTRDEMAWVYAGVVSRVRGDYPINLLNEKIIKKWSKSGLIYIKEKAWKNLAICNKELDGDVAG